MSRVGRAAALRLQRDLNELDLPSTMQISVPDPSNVFEFGLAITPDEGYYKKGTFHFTFKIPPSYPHDAPKVRCTETIYHPNIDTEGAICLNILREDWNPVLSLQAVVVGLQMLFLEPNATDPLNKAAAEKLRKDPAGFKTIVDRTLRGGVLDGVTYSRVVR